MIPCPSCDSPVARVRSDPEVDGARYATRHVAEPCGHPLGAEDLLRLGRSRTAAATAGSS